MKSMLSMKPTEMEPYYLSQTLRVGLCYSIPSHVVFSILCGSVDWVPVTIVLVFSFQSGNLNL